MNCVLFAKMDQVFSKENKTIKNTGNWKKYWKSQGILSVRKSGNPASMYEVVLSNSLTMILEFVY